MWPHMSRLSIDSGADLPSAFCAHRDKARCTDDINEWFDGRIHSRENRSGLSLAKRRLRDFEQVQSSVTLTEKPIGLRGDSMWDEVGALTGNGIG